MSNSISSTKILSSIYKSDLSSPNVNEFIGEETLITIIPSIDHNEFELISGTFGPLFSGLPCQVPLWLALTLKRQGKCLIKLPSWLNSSYLSNAINHEKGIRDFSSEDSEVNNVNVLFKEIPHYYYEIASLLLTQSDSTNSVNSLVSSSSSSAYESSDFHLLSLVDNLFQLRIARLRVKLTHFSKDLSQMTGDEGAYIFDLIGVKSCELLVLRRLLTFLMTSSNLFVKKEQEEEYSDDDDDEDDD